MSTMEPDEGAQPDEQQADAPRWDTLEAADAPDAPRWDEVQEPGDDAGSDDPADSTDT